MPATLFTTTDLEPRYEDLVDFVQGAFEIARRARKLQTDPDDADAFTLDQTDPVAEEANILEVEDLFKKMKDLIVKVDDGVSELEFAINFLRDRARRKPPLPSAIAGPPFGINTQETP